MRVGVLFSGGKDSVYSAYLAKKEGNEIGCLISIFSKNKESYMFHTPSIEETKNQAKKMNIPLIVRETEGKKEEELVDLENAIVEAIKKYKIEGVVSGAVESKYQSSRIKKICEKLKIKSINPLWKKNQIELLEELIENNFEVIVVGVFAYPLDEKWLLRKIDKNFISEIKKLEEKYSVNPSGEGGEIETFVLNCPMFESGLKIKSHEISGEKNSWVARIRTA